MDKEYFRYLIKTAGYSSLEFSKLLEVKLPTMQYKVRTESFTISEAKKICKLLNKDFKEIFGE